MALEFKSTKIKPEDFFGSLFNIRNQAHLLHLSTKSFSQHKALNDFYEEILDLTDGLIESYQGKYGILNITIPSTVYKDPIILIKELAKMTDGGAVYNSFKESWVLNQLDEISTLCYETLYKLENLK
jgi:hypothetical protein